MLDFFYDVKEWQVGKMQAYVKFSFVYDALIRLQLFTYSYLRHRKQLMKTIITLSVQYELVR